MADAHGKDTAVYISDSGGTQRNLTSFLDGCETSWERETADTSRYGTSARTRVGGMRNNTFSITGKFDNGATATPDQWLLGLMQAAATVVGTFYIFSNGSASGRPYDTGTAFITSYKKSHPYDDVVSFSADFEVNGDITRATA